MHMQFSLNTETRIICRTFYSHNSQRVSSFLTLIMVDKLSFISTIYIHKLKLSVLSDKEHEFTDKHDQCMYYISINNFHCFHISIPALISFNTNVTKSSERNRSKGDAPCKFLPGQKVHINNNL